MSESWNYSKVATLHSVALLGAFKQIQYRGVQFTNKKYKYFSRHPVYYVNLVSELLSIAWWVYISNKSARMLTDMYSSRLPRPCTRRCVSGQCTPAQPRWTTRR